MGVLNENAIIGASGGEDAYTIDYSCRFNSADNAYLTWTPGSDGNRTTYTFSFWIKRTEFTHSSVHQYLFSAGTAGNIYIKNGDEQIGIQSFDDGTDYRTAAQVFRDITNWYHIVVAVDTTQATDSNRVKFYVNGSEVSTWSGSTAWPAEDGEGKILQSGEAMMIGQVSGGAATIAFDGYMAEYHFVEGQQLTPSSFGETGDYGEWKPIEYDGGHGSNGFYLPFSNTATKHAITAVGNVQHSTAQEKIGDSSIYFDGTGDYLQVADHADFDLGDFTVELWMYNTESSSNAHILGNANHTVSGGAGGWSLYCNGNGVLKFNDYGNSWNTGDVSTGWSTSTWHHVAVTRSGSAVKMFVDGVQKYSGTPSSATLGGSNNFGLGSDNGNTTSMDYVGYMDEVRISNTARYTSGFTPSTSAFTEDANTVLLIHSDTTNGSTTFTDSSGVTGGLGNDASANSNHFTPTNIATSDQVTDTPTNNFQ